MSKAIKLISVNISRKNPLGSRALALVHKRRPDILCVQEVLQARVDRLTKMGYSTGKVEDYQHIGKLTGYLATAIKDKNSVISVEKARYYEKNISALWGIVYARVVKLRERHEGLVTKLRVNGKLIRVVNLHLTVACGPRVRIAQLTKMFERFADGNTFFCGDFNIANDMYFRLITGWACGYKWSDYFFDERKEVNKLIAKYELQNPFAKKKTITTPFHQQLDHILVPKQFKIVSKKMFKVPLSDHKALQVEVALD